MTMQEIRVSLGSRSYSIVIGRGVLSEIGGWMERLGLGRKVAVISNPAVAELYGGAVLDSLRRSGGLLSALPVH